MNRKKHREDGDLDWPSSNGSPNNTEAKPRPGAHLSQGHLFVSICQPLGSFLVRQINETHSRSLHLFLFPPFLDRCRVGARTATASQFHTTNRHDSRHNLLPIAPGTNPRSYQQADGWRRTVRTWNA